MPDPSNGRTSTNGHRHRLLTPGQTAALLTISERTLERWRARGHGPPHLRLTKRTIAYRDADVERWIASRLRTSTAARQPPQEVLQ